MVLYAVEEEIASFLKERVYREIKRFVVGCERESGERRVLFQRGETRWEAKILLCRCGRQLVEEGCEKVGVVDVDREFGKNILVTQTALL